MDTPRSDAIGRGCEATMGRTSLKGSRSRMSDLLEGPYAWVGFDNSIRVYEMKVAFDAAVVASDENATIVKAPCLGLCTRL